MSTDQTHAIVLRCVEFSETSLIVTLLTRDFGRMSAIAKGARRAKGPFEGSIDLLSVCRVVVIRKQSDALDLLTEAKLHRRFRGGQKTLQRLYAGYAVAELLRILIDDDQPHRDVYELTIAVLGQIDGTGNTAAALLYFEIQLLAMLGHNPGTDQCTDCGGPLQTVADEPIILPSNENLNSHPDSVASPGPTTTATDNNNPNIVDRSRAARRRWTFSLDAGGLVCGDCRTRQRHNIAVDWPMIQSLHYLADPNTSFPLMIDESVYGPLRSLVSRYMQTIAGKIPRMQRFHPHRLYAQSS